MTIFDVMPTWIAYILTGIVTIIPIAIAIGIAVLIIVAIKACIKYTKKKEK